MSRPDTRSRVRALLPWLVVALVSFLPVARGALAGNAFYFRDLSRQFFPLRRFALDGLRQGELRFWNPLLHEGEPVSLPPLSYLPDLLQLLRPDESGISLVLALHVPLGALGFMALARGLGVPLVGAAGGAILYSLGGFFLSTLNFYVYLQAAAWAPLLVLTLRRAAEGRTGMAAAAVMTAVAVSTTGAELVAQAVLIGLALGLGRAALGGRVLRMTLSLLLGLGLAAPTLATMRAAIAGSAREEGFAVAVVLAHAVHPLTLVQALVGNWHGDLGNLANRWWGSNFFPLGFPYFLSLYVGATAMGLVLVGLRHGAGSLRGRLGGLAAFGLVTSLGPWAGLRLVVDAAPFLRFWRHPSKAFFTVHLCLALLAALGLARLSEPLARGSWRSLALAAFALAGALTLAPALPLLAPHASAWFLAGFLPASYEWTKRLAVADEILRDAATGGFIAAGLGALAIARLQGLVTASRASAAAVALLATDLLRAGAGLNPMVSPSFYRLSPEMESVAATVRASAGRAFTCDPESGPEYFRARFLRSEHDVFTFATFMETLTPAYNMNAGIATALSRDLTMLVPEERVLAPEESGAGAVPRVLDRLRSVGVAWVLCLERLSDPRLRHVSSVSPERIAPAQVHVYALPSPLPLVELASVGDAVHPAGAGRIPSSERGAGWLRVRVETDRPARLVVRQAWAPGWSTRVDDQPAPLERAESRYLAVTTPSGSHAVGFSYAPPGLGAACATSLFSLAVLMGPWRARRRKQATR